MSISREAGSVGTAGTKRKATKKATPKKKRGRPSLFTQAIADRICAQLSQGIPLAEICRSEGYPAVRTISLWREKRPAFDAAYARARDEGFDAIAADCLRIADDTSNDTVVVGNDENAREAPNSEWIARSKLRIETRLRLLSKWDPKRYGEKLAVGGADDLPPVQTESKSDNEIARRLAFALHKGLTAGKGAQ
jgi:hypothetical protein